MKYLVILLFSTAILAQSPPNFPSFGITIDSNASSGQLFYSPFNNNSGPFNPPFLAIMNNDGSFLYTKELKKTSIDFKMQPNGNYTYYDSNDSVFYEMDKSFNIIDSFYIRNGYVTDPHDLQILPNGNVVLIGQDYEHVDMSRVVIGGNKNAMVIGCIIQELNVNKNVVFEWNSWDHYKITDATSDINLLDSVVDYFHANSLAIDTDGNFLLSARHLDEVVKINSNTGNIIWHLGGKNNQFYFINDTIGFSHQHCVLRISNGDIIMFDDGNLHNPPFSRAIEYLLDEVHKTAKLVWEYKNIPSTFTLALGSVQRLENGNTLIGWGLNNSNNTLFTEVTNAGTKVYELNMPYNYSYRVFRFNILPTSIKQNPQFTKSYYLSQNYPNPFNPSTNINYSIPFESNVNLKVYNTIGEKVKDIYSGIKQPGNYSININGSGLSSGIYFYSLTAKSMDGKQNYYTVKKMLLLK